MLSAEDWKIHYRTAKGYAAQMYKQMNKRAAKKGMQIMKRSEFLRWTEVSDEYQRLHREWEAADYERRLAPSIDRRNNEKGYEKDNLQFLTQRENSKKSHADVDRDRSRCQGITCRISDTETGIAYTFRSRKEAGRFLEVDDLTVATAIREGRKIKQRYSAENS